MALSDPIPVRFTEAADVALSAMAAAAKLKKAEIVRIAVDEFIARVNATGVIERKQVLATFSQVGGTGNSQQLIQHAPPAPPQPKKKARKKSAST